MTEPTYQYALPFILTTTGLVDTGAFCVTGIVVSSHTNGTLKLWDNTAGSGTVLVDTYTFPAGSGTYPLFGIKSLVGIYATVGGTLNATLAYTPYKG